MNKEQAVTYLRFSGFSEEQIKAIEGAFTCEDCISRQAAIDTIESWLSCDDYNEGERHIMRAMQSVLYDLPPVNPQKPICPSVGVDCEDCPAYEDAVSRRAVLNAINTDWHEDLSQLEDAIKALPPVTPPQKTGHWIFVDEAKEHARCSECNSGIVDLFNGKLHNYCEVCGAKMAEGSEE